MSQSPIVEPMHPQPAHAEAKKSNTGCLLLGLGGGCLVVVLICGGLIGAGIFGVFAMIKSSEPYTESLAKAQTNVELQSAIGDPIEPSVLVQGNINLNNDDGKADLNYSVSGPDGSATVHVVGTKTDGNWDYTRMDATTADGTTIDLLAD
ncbi:cytochrome c oxidase assembly factor 1 family protein [Rhodopirellula halodulae]|uniref:cytochrome c oxidase assembly factor 1 family protein n=1 Tax=Rhodopirellula halodulae TaxID=2894198 RepID=UPI001E5FDF50|nr:cytochrome c oxidase assembly factor 1 family protein [Rhodopirellula sp. JC737]MCC9658871.1 cytochrome c oxidase assembly factor 1 family protein [Rhodopirellula sp. JC737]